MCGRHDYPPYTTENPEHPGPEAVSVLVASRDPLTVRLTAPMVARKLYPGRTFGVVLHFEDADPPDWYTQDDRDSRDRCTVPTCPGHRTAHPREGWDQWHPALEWSEAAVHVIPYTIGASVRAEDDRINARQPRDDRNAPEE